MRRADLILEQMEKRLRVLANDSSQLYCVCVYRSEYEQAAATKKKKHCPPTLCVCVRLYGKKGDRIHIENPTKQYKMRLAYTIQVREKNERNLCECVCL